MRRPADPDRIRRLLEELGRHARGPGRVYLVGGATALLEGLDQIRGQLIRYPALDADSFERRVRQFLEADDD